MDALQKTIQRTLRNKRNQRRFKPVLPQVEYRPKFRVGLAPFVPTKITFPDAMVVEGAGGETMNTTYVRDGNENSQPYYEAPNGANILGFSLNWFITFAVGESIIYNSNDTAATPDLVPLWELNEFADSSYNPAPTTVRRATWVDIDAAGIDRSTVPLLE